MTKLYKLTTSDFLTRHDTKWGKGVTNTACPDKKSCEFGLCSSEVIHAYTHPALAVLLDRVHSGYLNKPAKGVLWLAEGEVKYTDGLKVGCPSLTTLRIIPVPRLKRLDVALFLVKAVESAEGEKSKNEAWNEFLEKTDETGKIDVSLIEKAEDLEDMRCWVLNVAKLVTSRNFRIKNGYQVLYLMDELARAGAGLIAAACHAWPKLTLGHEI